jgi:hypothetical protein
MSGRQSDNRERGGLLEGGPIAWLQAGTALAGSDRRRIVRGIVLTVAVGWVPIVALSGLQNAVGQPAGLSELFHDCAVHARSLIAAPLFVLADTVCTPRLAAIVRHFRDAGFVSEDQLERFDVAVSDTQRRAGSTAAGLSVIAAAYLIVLAVAGTASPQLVPAWHNAGTDGFSLAGWWHVLVSLPLLTALFCAWVWRVILWAQLLSRVARLDLKVMTVHPDRAAGLLFVGYSVRAFSAVALPMGCVAVGAICNGLLAHGAPRFADWLVMSTGLIAAFVMFAAPPLVFSGTLLRAWRRGIFEYGALAGRMGRSFEQKWFVDRADVDGAALEVPDFSATTDLYQVVSNAYRMRFAPVDAPSLLLLFGAVLVPLVPVILLTIPFDNVVAGLKGLLL